MSDPTFYDPAKLAEAIAAQGAGADGRTVLQGQYLQSILNPLSGLTQAQAGLLSSYYPSLGSATGSETANQWNPTTYNAGGLTLTSGVSPVNTQYATQADYEAAQKALAQQYGLDPSGNYAYGTFTNPTGGASDTARAIYRLDGNGNAVTVSGMNSYSNSGAWVGGMRDWAKDMALAAASIYGAGSAMGGSGGAGGGAAGSAAGGASSSDLAALYGPSGYGEGMSAAGGLGGAGGAAGAVGGAGAAGGGGAAAGGGAMSGSWIPGISNGQLLQSGAGLLGAVAGAVGSKNGLNNAVNSTQNKVDPRIAQYLYGQDGNGGLLSNVNSLTNSQLATGGLNPTQQQGLQMQLGALNNPAYGASLNQMRNVGSGLLGGAPAGNPFTQGMAPVPASAAQSPSMGNWQPMRTQLNQPGMQTGLLGNLRPYGA